MRHQFSRWTQPESVKEVNVWHALCQRSPDHRLLAKLLIRKQLANDGAEGDVGQ